MNKSSKLNTTERLQIAHAELKAKMDELKAAMEELHPLVELRTPSEMKTATDNSLRGIRAVLFGEKAFRTDIVVFVVCTVLASVLPVSWCERAVMIYTVFIALMAEVVNTAIETVVDRISMERHELSGRAKDIGSAVVFIAFLGAGISWFVILLGIGLRLLESYR